jgi:hypothetical protein
MTMHSGAEEYKKSRPKQFVRERIINVDFVKYFSKVSRFNAATNPQEQGCQMVSFRTENPNLGKLCGVL